MERPKDEIWPDGATTRELLLTGTGIGGPASRRWGDVQRREGSGSDGRFPEGAGASRPAGDGDATQPGGTDANGGSVLGYDVPKSDLDALRNEIARVHESMFGPDREENALIPPARPVREDPIDESIDPRFKGAEPSERPMWRGPMEVSWVDRNWSRIAPLLAKLCERQCEHGMTVQGLGQRIANGTYKVWVMGDFECVFLTSIYPQQNGRLMLSLSWAAGEGATDPNNGLHYIEAYARMHGCYGVEVMGRKGWERVLKGFGYNPFYVGVMKPL